MPNSVSGESSGHASNAALSAQIEARQGASRPSGELASRTSAACPVSNVRSAMNRPSTSGGTDHAMALRRWGDPAMRFSCVPDLPRAANAPMTPPIRLPAPSQVSRLANAETDLCTYRTAMEKALTSDLAWHGALKAVDVKLVDKHGVKLADGDYLASGLTPGHYPRQWKFTLEQVDYMIGELARFSAFSEQPEATMSESGAEAATSVEPANTHFVLEPYAMVFRADEFTESRLAKTLMSISNLGFPFRHGHVILDRNLSDLLVNRLLTRMQQHPLCPIDADALLKITEQYATASERGAVLHELLHGAVMPD